MTSGTAKIQVQDAEYNWVDVTDASWTQTTTGSIELFAGKIKPVLTGDATIRLI